MIMPGLRRSARGLILIAVAGCGSAGSGSPRLPSLPPGVVSQHADRAYPVRGVTRAEIFESLLQTRVANGGSQGRYSWTLEWSYGYRPVDDACRSRDVVVRLTSQTLLPAWQDRARADSALAGEWDIFLGRLREHEEHHRAIVYRAAREVYYRLQRLSVPSCQAFSPRANAAAREIMDRYRRLDAAYDEDTDHGRTEGVAWPVRTGSGVDRGAQVDARKPDRGTVPDRRADDP